MRSLGVSPEELLRQILKDSPGAVLRQKELFESNYPLLISFLKGLRRTNAVLNKSDVIHRNAEMSPSLLSLCICNYLFFLVATGNILEARKRKLNLMTYFKKKYHKPVHRNNFWSNLPVRAQVTQEAEFFMDEIVLDKNLFKIDFFRYHTIMLMRAFTQYKATQSSIYYDMAMETMGCLERLIKAATANFNPIASLKKNILQNQAKYLETQRFRMFGAGKQDQKVFGLGQITEVIARKMI